MYFQQIFPFLSLVGFAFAACPYMDEGSMQRRDGSTETFLSQFELNDSNSVMTSDVGGPIGDQFSLKAGDRGSTLLEDFIFRQKIQHFDHERCLNEPSMLEVQVHMKHLPATEIGRISRQLLSLTLRKSKRLSLSAFRPLLGPESTDSARDMHGFATRFYTDEGNFDIVGNNIPAFFIQDAIRFPDLIHAVKPSPDNEIPQAATARDAEWDFFSQQPSSLHTLFWAMADFGIPRSFRHMDGFGVHTFRFVTDDGQSKLVKWHWKSLQGKASLVWEEAQVLAGNNADANRQDLWNATATNRYPEWASTFINYSLPSISTLTVGILAFATSPSSFSQGASLRVAFSTAGAVPAGIGEFLTTGIDLTYSEADASGFDGIVVSSGAEVLFAKNSTSSRFPLSRPSQILIDGYRWGKPVGSLGSASTAFESTGIKTSNQPGVYVERGNDVNGFVNLFEDGLKTFKFVDRFPLD